jgi:mono/diheme cytochrome c family protein
MNQQPGLPIPTVLTAPERRRVISVAVFFHCVARIVITGRRGKLIVAVVLLVGLSLSGIYSGRQARAKEHASAVVAAAAQKKLSRKQQQLASAKVVYMENCARCHGGDGRGQTPMGKVFAATNLADASWWKKERVNDKRLVAAIRDGRGQMPPFGKKLSKEEIAALAAFVKTFNGK